MLTISDVTKRFTERAAVLSVNLNLLPGERLCLLGHNGAGKTTLLRMIVGMSRPSKGSLLILGKNPVTQPEARRHLGYLSDKPYVYDKLNCIEHLELHAALYKLSPAEVLRTGTNLFSDLGMENGLGQRAETLSFGTQKKLALVLALAHRPDVLVLDEPLNGLDPASADRMEETLRRYVTEDRAVILSTHSTEFASRFATRIAYMREGRLMSRIGPERDHARCSSKLLPDQVPDAEGRSVEKVDRI